LRTDRVNRLMLYGGFARGGLVRSTSQQQIDDAHTEDPCQSSTTPFRNARPETPVQGSNADEHHEKFLPSEGTTCMPGANVRTSWRGLLARLAAWVTSCADHYAVAAAYEELSRLSDAELKRRALTRDILARDLSSARLPPMARRVPPGAGVSRGNVH
jgi:hypothetical protein